jgi:hypothetical protein
MSAVTVPVPPAHQRLLDASSQALLQQLIAATPAQISAYMAANVTSLASAQTVLTALAVGLRYVYLLKQSQ